MFHMLRREPALMLGVKCRVCEYYQSNATRRTFDDCIANRPLCCCLRRFATGVLQEGSASGRPAVPAGASDAALAAAATAGGKKGGLKSVLEGLDELWDENQYAEEFGLEGFMSKLSGPRQ